MANNRLKLTHKELTYQESPTIMKYYPSTGWYFCFDNLEEKLDKLTEFFKSKNLTASDCVLELEGDEGISENITVS